MKHAPNLDDEDDAKEVAELNAEPWQLALLDVNPSYLGWGVDEDYMIKRGTAWDASYEVDRLSSADAICSVNDLNEIVHFYFEVNRESVKCDACDGSGQNRETKRIADNFYAFEGHRFNRWCDKITQDELDALVAAGRFSHEVAAGRTPTLDQVNLANGDRRQSGGFLMMHDAINRWILVETRAKREGVFGKCDACDGKGHLYTSPTATVSVTFWVLHPRKGASRGVRVNRVEREDLPAIFALLNQAAERNAERFSKLAMGVAKGVLP